MTDEEVVNRIIYRDAMILVLNKPHGIAVHPANGSVHNLEQYFHLLQFGLPHPPVLAHRLDLGTSGCLVLARHKEAARRLQVMFTDGHIKKSYVAVVRGTVEQDEGRIDVPLSKQSPQKNHWWMKADPEGGISALTDYQVIKRENDRTWLRLIPHTGRTHQLRVHCKVLQTPILGDYIYGEEDDKPLHLHAHTIAIPLYKNKPALLITAPFPTHMQNDFL